MSCFLKCTFLIILITVESLTALSNVEKEGLSDFGNKFSITTKENANTPTATITGTTSVCMNDSRPSVVFTGQDGTPPYTFVYQINGGTDITTKQTDTGKDTIMVKAPTDVAGVFLYTLKKVSDTNNTLLNASGTAIITVESIPNADFTFTNNNSCSGTSITFTPSSVGNYSYLWDFNDGITSTAVTPIHSFKATGTGIQTYNVELTITNNITGCQNKNTEAVQVIMAPDASFNLDPTLTPYDVTQRIFINCSATITSPNFNFHAVNGSSTRATNTGYIIDWGDGSTPENLPIDFDDIYHEYKQLGYFDIKLTAVNDNAECTSANTIYKFFNGNSPAGNLGSLGNTTDCAPYTLKWPVENIRNNPPGTTYEFSVNDGSTPQRYDHSNIPDTISHTFLQSSCGLSNDKFTIIFTATNPCDQNRTTTEVKANLKPTADFSISTPQCLNSKVTFTNTSSGNYDNCNSAFSSTWSITPATGWTGSLANQNSIDITFITAGEYSVKLKIKKPNSSDSRCNSDSITKLIRIHPLPTGNISWGATVCKDDPLPEITFTGTSGEAPFTFAYKINNGSIQNIATTSGNSVILKAPTNNSGKFTYTLVRVQDATGCSQTQTGDAVIEVMPAPTATISGPQNTCQNAPYPLITFTGNGGTQPYTFTYNIDNGTSKTISTTDGNTVTVEVPTENLGTFKYNLVGVTDASANACVSSQTGTVSITVNQPPAPLTLIDYEYCNGISTTPIVFTNTVTGTTYKWTNSDTSIGLSASGTGNIPFFLAKNSSASPVISTITVTPIANGCDGNSQTFTITVNPSASVIFTPENQIICSGENSQSVQLSSATTGATFSWIAEQPTGITGVTTNGTDIIPVQTLINTTNAPVDVVYKAKATVSGATSCAGTEYNYTITVNPIPEIKEAFNITSCSNLLFELIPTDGGSNLIPAGTKYTWTNPLIEPFGALTGASEQNVPQTAISQTLINNTSMSASAIYTVTPSFNGCPGDPFEIKVVVEPSPFVDPVNDITLCNLEQSPEIIFSGSQGETVFEWSSNNTDIGIPSSGTNSIPSFIATNDGTSPVITTITVVPTNDNDGLICEGTPFQFSIIVNPTGQTINPGTQNVCSGLPVTINFETINTGGETTYSWSNDNVTIGLSDSGSGNIAFTPINNGNSVTTGTVTVTPTYTNNGVSCRGMQEQFTVTVNPIPTVNQPPNQTLCNGILTNEVLFTGSVSEQTFFWNNDNPSIGLPPSGQGSIAPFIAKNNTADPITATITVTPSINGCDGPPKNFTITVNPSGIITEQPVSSDVCLGDVPNKLSVAFTNGTGPPSYQWYSNNINSYIVGAMIPGAIQSSFDPPFSIADTVFYYCIISFPSGTCNILISDIARVAINANPKISVLNAEINSGETFIVIPNSQNGDIVPTGTVYTWTEPSIDPPGSVTGASAQLIPQSSISQTLTSNVTGTATVTYTVTPTSGSCIGADFQVIVKVHPPLLTTTNVTPVTCFGANDAIIEVFVSGGVSPYQIEWSNMGTGDIQTDLSPGIYTITITDAAGIQKTITETVYEANLFLVNPIVKQITCHGANNASIALNFEGGAPPVTLNWDDNASAGDTRNNLGPGVYNVVILDSHGCEINESFTIIEPLPILLSAVVTNSLGCSEENKGAIDLTASGGEPPYSYSWSNGSTNEDLSNIPAGVYQVIVSDINGCANAATYTVNRPGEIQITVETSMKYDCSTEKVTQLCTAIVKGGFPPHQIEWSTGSASGPNNEFMETDQSGLVVVQVTDALGCIASHSFTVNIPMLGIDYQLLNCDLHSYGFNAIIGDESQQLTYRWDFNDGSTSDLRNPIHNFKQGGLYHVSLTTNNIETSCISNYEVSLQVEPRPDVEIDKNPRLCEGDTLTIYANGADTYRWSTGSSNDFENFKYAGNYFVIGYTNAGCTDTAYFDVSYFSPRGYKIFTDKQEITNKQRTVHFWTDDIPFSRYRWDFDDGTIANGVEQYHSFDQFKDGYFDVTLNVINPDGCLETDSVKIYATLELLVNTFTPNNDGINDIYMSGWDLKIYNRNGILLYEGKDGWDGTYNGKMVANDTYFVIVYDSSETGSQYRTGYVTVIR